MAPLGRGSRRSAGHVQRRRNSSHRFVVAIFLCALAQWSRFLWGTMHIPYHKAYLTGMNPLSFVTFFTVGELGMMATLAVTYRGLAPHGTNSSLCAP